MIDVEGILENLKDEHHRRALLWFHEHRGQDVSWKVIKESADQGLRLANLPKGIFRPKGSDYSLSAKITLGEKYSGEDIVLKDNGGWVVKYQQEIIQGRNSWFDLSANRGLMNCRRDQIPIGFIWQVKGKPGSTIYHIYGLGLVTDFSDGYFTLEGFKDNGSIAELNDAKLLEHNQTNDFDLSKIKDEREIQSRLICLRRGQQKFRNQLLNAYRRQCCITHCDVVETLEAAHISPYQGIQTHHIQNGLLLRSDFHTLFDLGGFYISDDYKVVLADRFKASDIYGKFNNVVLTLPEDKESWPHLNVLRSQAMWARERYSYT